MVARESQQLRDEVMRSYETVCSHEDMNMEAKKSMMFRTVTKKHLVKPGKT